MAPPTVPPELPPSVEEAYRKKCIQLKTRLNQVEEANDASRLRIERLNRAIEKGRLERAFLLEQLAKRTSTNVEDSEGSPSPPPTPKEKPLRTKRGHRKPDFLTTDVGDGRPGSAFIQQGPVTLSPSSDAFSHTHPDPLRNSTPQAHSNSHNKKHLPSNGTHAPSHPAPGTSRSSRPRSAFDVYCDEHRPIVLAERKDLKDDGEIESILAKGWTTLNTEKRAEYSAKFDQIRKAVEADREPPSGAKEAGNDAEQSRGEADEDVEMGDDVGTPIPAAGGFTAVNN